MSIDIVPEDGIEKNVLRILWGDSEIVCRAEADDQEEIYVSHRKVGIIFITE